MTWLIELALNNTRAVTVAMLALVLLGVLALLMIPTDILPVYDRPGVQVLTFYSGMPAESISHAITNRMERWTGTAGGMLRQESRSILGCSIVRNYFHSDIDPNGALTQVQSLALAEIPNLPPGTLPPIVLPYDPTDTVPSCIVAVDSSSEGESALYDVARYEVRNRIMSSPGANAPVVYGGKVRCVLAYLDPIKLQARRLSPVDVMEALDRYNVFLPTGDAKFGDLDYAIDSNSMFQVIEHMKDIPLRVQPDKVDFLGDVASPEDAHFIQTNVVRINGKREVYIPVYRQHGASTLKVVDHLRDALPSWAPGLSRPDINLKLVMDQSVYVRQSIKSLAIEGLLGAILCSLVILLFLGQWRMTIMAVLTIPIAVLASLFLLYITKQTINIMTLGGLALAIGPMVDSAIICLENTERHLSKGDFGARGGQARCQRGSSAGTGGQLQHAVSVGAFGLDAQFRAVPLQTDGPGRRLRHVCRLHPIALVYPVALRHLAEGQRPCPRKPRAAGTRRAGRKRRGRREEERTGSPRTYSERTFSARVLRGAAATRRGNGR